VSLDTARINQGEQLLQVLAECAKSLKDLIFNELYLLNYQLREWGVLFKPPHQFGIADI
jgi:hypothetical protein